MKKDYNGKMFKVKLSNDIPALEFTFNNFDKVLFKNIKEEMKLKFAPKLIKKIAVIINNGGSRKVGYGWTYWKRSKGEKEFKAITPSISRKSFSWGLKNYNKNNELIYPVHPATYFGAMKNGTRTPLYFTRTSRKIPLKGQYALTDTGKNVSNKFVPTFWGSSKSKTMFMRIYSSDAKLVEAILRHEKGFSTKSGQHIIRKVIEPAWLSLKPQFYYHVKITLDKFNKELKQTFNSKKGKK